MITWADNATAGVYVYYVANRTGERSPTTCSAVDFPPETWVAPRRPQPRLSLIRYRGRDPSGGLSRHQQPKLRHVR